MAEFPELGKNCSLKTCNRLDYTPFLCNLCGRYYCGEHRLSHGCIDNSEPTSSSTSGCVSAPLRPYLCAMEGCFLRESIRIECPHCELNFCLRHRHADQHNCKCPPENDEKAKRKGAWVEVGKKIESSQKYFSSNEAICEARPKKVLNEAEQKRADRIAIMKLKSKAKACDIPLAEQMFLIVAADNSRIPVMVSKRWTVGRCVDKLAIELNVSNKNADYGAKMLRLYCIDDQLNALPMGDNIAKHLMDMAVVSLKRDQ